MDNGARSFHHPQAMACQRYLKRVSEANEVQSNASVHSDTRAAQRVLEENSENN
jgi:hypothetical protein